VKIYIHSTEYGNFWQEEKKAEKFQKKQAKRQQIEVRKERVNLICEMLTTQQTLKSFEDEHAKHRAAAVSIFLPGIIIIYLTAVLNF